MPGTIADTLDETINHIRRTASRLKLANQKEGWPYLPSVRRSCAQNGLSESSSPRSPTRFDHFDYSCTTVLTALGFRVFLA